MRKGLKLFIRDMQKKLNNSSRKGGWKNKYWINDAFWITRISEEFRELLTAILDKSNNKNREASIIEECADIANYCMMLADNHRNQKGGRNK